MRGAPDRLFGSLVHQVFRGPPARASASLLERLAGAPDGAFAVLTYHRVDATDAKPWLYPPLLSATPDEFERQMRALREHSRPIALAELLAARSRDRPLPPRAVLVTFDDAYRDFHDNAWPLVKYLGIPVTMFVPTGYPDAPDRPFWWDRLWQAVVESRGSAKLDTPIGTLSVADGSARRMAARSLVEFHKTLMHDEAMRSVDRLCDALGAHSAKSEVLGWDALRALAADGVDLAAHSRHHPLLTRLPPSELAAQLDGSRRDLESHAPGSLGSVFAYPGGRYDEQVTQAVAKLGFKLAFTTQRGVNRLGHTDPLRLRRINVGRRSRWEVIRAQLALGALRDAAASRRIQSPKAKSPPRL